MNRFQVIIRLQRVRALINEPADQHSSPRSQLEAISKGLQWVAEAAVEQDLTAYVYVCRKVIERLNDLVEHGEIPPLLIARIDDWAAMSELYIRRPQFRQFGRMVVLQLNDPLWGPVINHHDQVGLIEELCAGRGRFI
jgi:hypothetical protein